MVQRRPATSTRIPFVAPADQLIQAGGEVSTLVDLVEVDEVGCSWASGVRTHNCPGKRRRTSRYLVLDGVVVSLLAWALLAVLERRTSSAQAIWRVVAVLALLLSLSAPLSGTGVTLGDRLWLA
jgi:hypothetical protein